VPLVGIFPGVILPCGFSGDFCFNGGYGLCFIIILVLKVNVLFVKMLKVDIWLCASCFLNFWYCVSTYIFQRIAEGNLENGMFCSRNL